MEYSFIWFVFVVVVVVVVCCLQLKDSPLESLVIGHGDSAKLLMLQRAYNEYFQSIMSVSVRQAKLDAAGIDRKVTASEQAARVAIYDLNHHHDPAHESILRHRQLAGMLLTRYGQVRIQYTFMLRYSYHTRPVALAHSLTLCLLFVVRLFHPARRPRCLV